MYHDPIGHFSIKGALSFYAYEKGDLHFAREGEVRKWSQQILRSEG